MLNLKKSDNQIKGFLFDLGNVIIPFSNYLAIHEVKPYSKKTVKEIYDIFLESAVVNKFSEGKLTPEDFFEKIKDILEISIDFKFIYFKKIWNNIFSEDIRMTKLIKKISKNYKIGIISNINKLHYEYIRNKFKIFKEVDEIILSYKVGCQKPDKKIYEFAINKMNINAGNLIYIDDRLELIKAGEKIGFKCIHYTSFDNFFEKLLDYNIL